MSSLWPLRLAYATRPAAVERLGLRRLGSFAFPSAPCCAAEERPADRSRWAGCCFCPNACSRVPGRGWIACRYHIQASPFMSPWLTLLERSAAHRTPQAVSISAPERSLLALRGVVAVAIETNGVCHAVLHLPVALLLLNSLRPSCPRAIAWIIVAA